MKTIGLIGGVSWESTAVYYSLISLSDHASPQDYNMIFDFHTSRVNY